MQKRAQDDWDSDALDEEEEEEPKKRKKRRVVSPRKKRVRKEESLEDELELEEGQEVVGLVVKAPTTGLVPPGQISRNTLDFLTKLKDPECNDRQWLVRA